MVGMYKYLVYGMVVADVYNEEDVSCKICQNFAQYFTNSYHGQVEMIGYFGWRSEDL